jgi:putative RNA 2'-phosphotransferase
VDEQRLITISKYLSRHLRHRPERLGLTLEPGGWVAVSALLAACSSFSFPLTLRELEEVVERNDKRRFCFDDARQRIRAQQGHSVDVDLQLPTAPPPPTLFHGTNARALDQIEREGLRAMGRHHVHLSRDVATATRVGARRGRPVVLEVAAERMLADGYDFYVTGTASGWWATCPPSTCPARRPGIRASPRCRERGAGAQECSSTYASGSTVSPLSPRRRVLLEELQPPQAELVPVLGADLRLEGRQDVGLLLGEVVDRRLPRGAERLPPRVGADLVRVDRLGGLADLVVVLDRVLGVALAVVDVAQQLRVEDLLLAGRRAPPAGQPASATGCSARRCP